MMKLWPYNIEGEKSTMC